MISPEERIQIKKILGHRYGNSVAEFMKKEGYRNEKGEPYSTSMIRNVMNGISNATVEKGIFQFVAIKKKEQKALRAVLD